MGHPGLEPGANRLKAEYSTIELVTLWLENRAIYQCITTLSLSQGICVTIHRR